MSATNIQALIWHAFKIGHYPQGSGKTIRTVLEWQTFVTSAVGVWNYPFADILAARADERYELNNFVSPYALHGPPPLAGQRLCAWAAERGMDLSMPDGRALDVDPRLAAWQRVVREGIDAVRASMSASHVYLSNERFYRETGAYLPVEEYVTIAAAVVRPFQLEPDVEVRLSDSGEPWDPPDTGRLSVTVARRAKVG